MTMRKLTLPGWIPGTSVELMVDDSRGEARAAIVSVVSPCSAVWLCAALADVSFDSDWRQGATVDLWFDRCCLTLPIEHRAQVEAFLTPNNETTTNFVQGSTNV